MNSITPLQGTISEKIWGWENWILSCHPHGNSTTISKNTPLSQFLLEEGMSKLAKEFPILIKIIQANEPLSIQVHPNDEYAQEKEGSFGKSECWYILSCDEEAEIIVNFKEKITQKEFREVLEENLIEDYVRRVKVQPGSFIYIPAGTIHAIGGGIQLLEIQESSDITYRVFDYNRGREIHIEKSLEVTNYEKSNQFDYRKSLDSFECPYFNLKRYLIPSKEKISINLSKEFPLGSIIATKGDLSIKSKEDRKSVTIKEKNASFLQPDNFEVANENAFQSELVFVEAKSNPPQK